MLSIYGRFTWPNIVAKKSTQHQMNVERIQVLCISTRTEREPYERIKQQTFFSNQADIYSLDW